MPSNLCHCSICNLLFQGVPKTCPYCNSKYVHYADKTCKSMTYNEWKNDEEIALLVDSIPDATGDDTDIQPTHKWVPHS